MTYSVENAKDNAQRHMMVVLNPRIRAEEWAVHSGSVYRTAFTHGYVTGVSHNGTALTEAASASLSAGQYWLDPDAGFLYVRRSDSGDPGDAAAWMVVSFELYIATKEMYFHRIPTDSGSRVVHWRGIITQTPSVIRSITDTIFGFSPVQSTAVECLNDPEYFQEILYGMSLNLSEIVAYHLVGSLRTSNVQKLFTGVGDNFSFDDQNLRISILDKSYIFEERMNNGAEHSQYPATSGSGAVDPQFFGRGVRTIYGAKSGVRGINIDFYAGQSSDNYTWAFMTSAWGTNYWAPTVTAHTATTRTVGLYEARSIQKALDLGYNRCLLDTGIFGTISSVDTATGVITHSNDLSGGSATQFKLVPYKNLKLLQGDTAYDYLAGGAINGTPNVSDGFCIIGLGAETNVSGTDPSQLDGSSDYFICDVLGPLIAPTISGSKFGDAFNPITILYHILKDRLGLDESEIDTAAFLSVASSINHSAGFDLIEDEGALPSYRDVINRLLLSCFLRAYIDQDGKFTISRIGPTADPADFTISDDDIIGQQAVDSVFREITAVQYRSQKIAFAPRMTNGQLTGHAVKYVLKSEAYDDSSDVEYGAQTYLHRVSRTRIIETYNRFISAGEDTAAVLAARYAQILGERKNHIGVFIKTGAHGIDIGDTVQFTRAKQPGFAYASGTTYDRKYVVVEVKKEVGGVFALLDDQKAIEENAGDW